MKDFPGVLIVVGYLVAIFYLFSDGINKAEAVAVDFFRPNMFTSALIVISIATYFIVTAINKNGGEK